MPLPLTAEDWAPYLEASESLLWCGASSFRYALAPLGFVVAALGLCAYLYGSAALEYGALAALCGKHIEDTCAKFYYFRWPGFIVSILVFPAMLFEVIARLFGWAQVYFALTDHRALLIRCVLWRKDRGRLVQIDFRTDRPRKVMGGIAFGSRGSGQFFFGLSPDDCSALLAEIDAITKADRQ